MLWVVRAGRGSQGCIYTFIYIYSYIYIPLFLTPDFPDSHFSSPSFSRLHFRHSFFTFSFFEAASCGRQNGGQCTQKVGGKSRGQKWAEVGKLAHDVYVLSRAFRGLSTSSDIAALPSCRRRIAENSRCPGNLSQFLRCKKLHFTCRMLKGWLGTVGAGAGWWCCHRCRGACAK